MTNIPILIQAAMGSRRLPGKSLARVGGHPLIDLVIQRASRAKLASDLYVLVPATVREEASQLPLISHLRWLIGTEHVVIGTTEKGHAGAEFKAAVDRLQCVAFVRLTADNPFVDPHIIDGAVRAYRSAGALCHGVATHHDSRPYAGYPPGFDVEVIDTHAWCRSVDEEHVTRSLYEQESEGIAFLDSPIGWPVEVNVTVDTSADLERIRSIYADLGPYATYEQIVGWFGVASPAHQAAPCPVDGRSISAPGA